MTQQIWSFTNLCVPMGFLRIETITLFDLGDATSVEDKSSLKQRPLWPLLTEKFLDIWFQQM